jgi:hypothetical protein
MLFQFVAECSHDIDALIELMPKHLLHSIELPKENTMNAYDGAHYDIITIITVSPTVSLEDLKGYMGQVHMGERMIRTVQPLELTARPDETTTIYPAYAF